MFCYKAICISCIFVDIMVSLNRLVQHLKHCIIVLNTVCSHKPIWWVLIYLFISMSDYIKSIKIRLWCGKINLTNCNRLVITKLEQAMRTHIELGFVWKLSSFGCVGVYLSIYTYHLCKVSTFTVGEARDKQRNPRPDWLTCTHQWGLYWQPQVWTEVERHLLWSLRPETPFTQTCIKRYKSTTCLKSVTFCGCVCNR